MMQTLIQILLLFSLSSVATADVLFEGYHKVFLNDQHIGLSASRYEFDAKKNQFKATYFLKTTGGSLDVTESLKATSSKDLTPLSYEYTTLVGKDSKVIDAKINKGVLSGSLREKGKVTTLKTELPKGSFLATFLTYLILQSPKGLQENASYEYQAVAEEDGSLSKGTAQVGSLESKLGISVYKVTNTFKGSSFLSYITAKGEVVSTEATAAGVRTELVSTLAEAQGKITVSTAMLSGLFGKLPEKSSLQRPAAK